jgi:hypothetical protein
MLKTRILICISYFISYLFIIKEKNTLRNVYKFFYTFFILKKVVHPLWPHASKWTIAIISWGTVTNAGGAYSSSDLAGRQARHACNVALTDWVRDGVVAVQSSRLVRVWTAWLRSSRPATRCCDLNDGPGRAGPECPGLKTIARAPRFGFEFGLLRTTLPRITRSAPFPPVSSRGARRCREPVSLPISTTEKTHETLDIGLGLWPLSDLYSIWGVQVLYIETR